MRGSLAEIGLVAPLIPVGDGVEYGVWGRFVKQVSGLFLL